MGIEDAEPQLETLAWEHFYDFCKKHAILGVGFAAVEKIAAEKRPPKAQMLRWYSIVNSIEQSNQRLNERCKDITQLFAEKNFRSCILKGQGNAEMYPQPLRRQSGDIDIWVEGRIHDIIRYMESLTDAELYITYHHTEFPIWNDVAIEVHYRPTWLNSPFKNHRLQKWFEQNSETQFSNKNKNQGYVTPTTEFNLVYQLLHIFHHFMEEGIGLRQIIDYYYLLLRSSSQEREEAMLTIADLGLKRFAGALMYVLRYVFKLSETLMLCSPDAKNGASLLAEIMQSGNFGHYDDRNEYLLQKSGIVRKLYQGKRLVHLLLQYPKETMCAPCRLSHVIWRKLKLWRFE